MKFYLLLTAALFSILYFLPISKQGPAINIGIEKEPPEIEARGAFAQDLISGEVLFFKNPKEILPLASLTKILSGLVVLDRVDLEDEIEIMKGEHLKTKDLLAMAMVESSNDAITVLFEYASQKNEIVPDGAGTWFLDLMRKKAESSGAESMNFNNVTGYDISPSVSGGYGSAEDIMKIAKSSLASPLWQFGEVREIISREGIKHALKPTNELAPELTPLIGSKTGYTDLAGGNLLVIVEYPIGRPLGIVVLGSSAEGRFSDVKKILEWIKAAR